MSATLTVEDRLTIVETELATLKQAIGPVGPKQSWIEKVAGSFKDDPEFGEILRLGQEIRKADKTDVEE